MTKIACVVSMLNDSRMMLEVHSWLQTNFADPIWTCLDFRGYPWITIWGPWQRIPAKLHQKRYSSHLKPCSQSLIDKKFTKLWLYYPLTRVPFHHCPSPCSAYSIHLMHCLHCHMDCRSLKIQIQVRSHPCQMSLTPCQMSLNQSPNYRSSLIGLLEAKTKSPSTNCMLKLRQKRHQWKLPRKWHLDWWFQLIQRWDQRLDRTSYGTRKPQNAPDIICAQLITYLW